jgi:hypothetical protein
MRGSIVVLALAMSSFVGSVSKAQDTASTSIPKVCVKDPGNPSSSGDDNRSKKCPAPPPANTGKVTISGNVFFDLAPYDGVFDPANEVGIAGWNVVLTGPTGSMSFMTVTGDFSFAGLPGDATYTLCVQPSAGWTQTSPTSGAACLNSFGYTIVVPPLAADSTITGKDFGFYSNTTF